MPNTTDQTWLAVRDAAAPAVSDGAIRDWLETGCIKADRVGPRLIRVPVAELNRLGRPVGGAA